VSTEDVGHLVHRLLWYIAFISAITASQDASTAYVSMPLDGYHKKLVPGVSWLVMSSNCFLAARQYFKQISMFLRRQA
jgi:hypothetical protein